MIFETYRSSRTGDHTIDPLNDVLELQKEQCSADTIIPVARVVLIRYQSVSEDLCKLLSETQSRYELEYGCPPNSEREKDKLTSLKIIEKRYSFLFEDVWFILLQYMYFEKFTVANGGLQQCFREIP